WQRGFARAAATATVIRAPSLMHRLIPPEERRRPVVSVQDGASHSLAWIGSALAARQYPLGVDRFGESGTIADLHQITGISAASIVNAALIGIYEHDTPAG
ncbi:MAG: pyruvate dehydrogenase, partial [Actinomycetota bacterium]|nr:pyruvate dehydrogenase [Actinomycetota bacterium]